MHCSRILHALVAILPGMAFSASVQTATGTSAPLSVDTRSSAERRALTNDLVRYSPRYVTATNVPGAYVVLKKVVAGESGTSVTTTVVTCAAGAEGGLSLELGASDSRFLSLLHEVHAEGGALIGSPLAVDMAYGTASEPGAAFFCDTTTNGVQVLADARKIIPLAYSTDWTNDVASVRIDYSCEQVKRGVKYGECSGTLFSGDAPSAGTFDYATAGLCGGDYTLCYHAFDANGAELESYVATFTLPFKLGLMLMIK